MRRDHLLILCSAAVACTHVPQPAPLARPLDETRVVIDYAAIDAWLACVRTTTDRQPCDAASAATPGGHLASLAVPSFGDGPISSPAPALSDVAAVTAAMKTWPDVLPRAARFIPTGISGGPIRVFVVGNGHPQGDAYVQSFTGQGADVRLSDTGAPIILLNPVLIAANYTGSPDERANKAYGVMAHEVFHVLFRRYRDATPAWSAMAGELAPRDRLQLLVLNEGIAHYIAREDQLSREGFPRDRAEASLHQLASAWQQLAALPANAAEANALVRSASQGAYWDKYGSISGMLLVHGVFRSDGIAGIRDAVRCGPGRLLARYRAAAAQLAELPPLPDDLLGSAWLDLCH